MATYTAAAGFPPHFVAPVGRFRLMWSKKAVAVIDALGLDGTAMPLTLDTSRAALVEIGQDGETTERLHYRVAFGARQAVLVVEPYFRWRVTNVLEVDG